VQSSRWRDTRARHGGGGHRARAPSLLFAGAGLCGGARGFLFAKAGPLEELTNSSFVARRNEHWTAQAADENVSATGRFKALKRT